MSENRTTIHLIDVPIGGKDGALWNRLHGEREEICEKLLTDTGEGRQKFLQSRLRELDDALDRLMPGSDGPRRCDLQLESLQPFDTILLKTHNSDYRIMVLDPTLGRVLVEGGSYLTEPNEALLKGSAVSGSTFRRGVICVGSRLEMWVDERVIITSPVKSAEVVHHLDVESVADISSALH